MRLVGSSNLKRESRICKFTTPHPTQVSNSGSSEDVMQANDSELSFLRLQLRSIEVQCLEYIPEGADQELIQSIQNWKHDWAELRNKWDVRRRHSHELGSAGTVDTSGH